jgi:hypothetical protein
VSSEVSWEEVKTVLEEKVELEILGKETTSKIWEIELEIA